MRFIFLLLTSATWVVGALPNVVLVMADDHVHPAIGHLKTSRASVGNQEISSPLRPRRLAAGHHKRRD
jgi:hypothetical protein